MTFFETASQGRVFLLLLYAGAAAAVGYDLMSILRRLLPRPLGILLDVVWCLAAGGLCFCALALDGQDQLRLYALLGMACGAGVYCLGLRRLLRALFRLVKRLRRKTSAREPRRGER